MIVCWMVCMLQLLSRFRLADFVVVTYKQPSFSRVPLRTFLQNSQRNIHSHHRRRVVITMDTGLPLPHPSLLGKQIIILAGATSVGKSAVAAELCNHMNAEIVLADSVQIYKHLDIGSNKPSQAEMDSIPHHLVNLREPHETFSGGT